DDKDVTNLNYFSKKYFFRNTLGFLFQNYGLIDTWTVNQNLNIALAYKKFKRAEREEKKLLSLRKVAISGKKNKKVYTLSGGEQQRLALARLILKDAKIILCDEPSAALDADNVQNIIDILKTLAKEGAIVVISTHDQFVVNQCDRQINLDSIS
ncbi:MAG: ATP-binding cassette domain-containing protein, partial [Bifidobacteriaceae bacterium]|nr:ATP-binding cassette domain-containing protein [Bifidobacteriaceae bacterium]